MKRCYLRLLGLSTLLYQCENKEQAKILVPRQANDYIWIYKPAGDAFFGPDTKRLKEGEWYDEWIPNDHTFVKDRDGLWHIFGITHPLVETSPIDSPRGIHEGEYASFHAVSTATRFKETLKAHHYSDLPKVLPPEKRPGEILQKHAPYIVEKDGLYHMVYGPSPVRLAVSSDLSQWDLKGELFSESGGARDPSILLHNRTYYLSYCSRRSILTRKSRDLIHWSEADTIFTSNSFDPESPSLIRFNNSFYLFVCAWDGNWDGKKLQGAYQHKTYVYQSQYPLDFGIGNEKQIATLKSHAPEIFQDEDGQWYISSVEWPNRGVSVDRLEWVEQAKTTQGIFPYTVTEETKNRELSAAMQRSFENYSGIHPAENELYTQFKYTPLEGFDYHSHDGSISRRDPSKIIFENGKYYVWYTHRNTSTIPMGPDQCNDTIPSTDWDLCDIWYATSKDGFTWEEQGVAVPRPPEPEPGWRSVTTTDILKWKGKYYLYYQAFMEASGKRGDYCPVAVSYADFPDGPWTPTNEIVIPNGPEGAWDQYAIHDPFPLVHDGKIYLYYKSAFNRPGNVWVAGGLAIADDPLGPFEKHPLNPVLNSGHEVSLFPFKEGVAAIMVKDGNEHFTINYARDWVNFKIASVCELVPVAPAGFIPDAFTNTSDGRGITWGLSHFTNAGKKGINPHSILARFDCDLSQDLHDPDLKRTGTWHNTEVYFKQGLNKKQRERIARQNAALK